MLRQRRQHGFLFVRVNHKIHHPINLHGYEWPGDITLALDSFAFVRGGLYIEWHALSGDGNGFDKTDTVIGL